MTAGCVTATRVRVPDRFDLYHSSERSRYSKALSTIDSVDLLSVKILGGLSLNLRPLGRTNVRHDSLICLQVLIYKTRGSCVIAHADHSESLSCHFEGRKSWQNMAENAEEAAWSLFPQGVHRKWQNNPSRPLQDAPTNTQSAAHSPSVCLPRNEIRASTSWAEKCH